MKKLTLLAIIAGAFSFTGKAQQVLEIRNNLSHPVDVYVHMRDAGGCGTTESYSAIIIVNPGIPEIVDYSTFVPASGNPTPTNSWGFDIVRNSSNCGVGAPPVGNTCSGISATATYLDGCATPTAYITATFNDSDPINKTVEFN